MEVGYKVFRRDVITQVRLESSRFGIEPEITIKLARLGCGIYEVPISYHGRTYAEGKKTTWRDGLAALLDAEIRHLREVSLPLPPNGNRKGRIHRRHGFLFTRTRQGLAL